MNTKLYLTKNHKLNFIKCNEESSANIQNNDIVLIQNSNDFGTTKYVECNGTSWGQQGTCSIRTESNACDNSGSWGRFKIIKLSGILM